MKSTNKTVQNAILAAGRNASSKKIARNAIPQLGKILDAGSAAVKNFNDAMSDILEALTKAKLAARDIEDIGVRLVREAVKEGAETYTSRKTGRVIPIEEAKARWSGMAKRARENIAKISAAARALEFE